MRREICTWGCSTGGDDLYWGKEICTGETVSGGGYVLGNILTGGTVLGGDICTWGNCNGGGGVFHRMWGALLVGKEICSGRDLNWNRNCTMRRDLYWCVDLYWKDIYTEGSRAGEEAVLHIIILIYNIYYFML